MIINCEIVKKIQAHDRKVILELYKQTFNVLMSAAVQYKNNREDQMHIVNTSFLKIVTGIHHYKIGTAYFSWAKKIVSNTIIDDFRKNKNYKALFEVDSIIEDHGMEDESEIDNDIDKEALQKILDTLPPATKLVFSLFALEEYSTKEISKDLDISYETVKWHIKEARKRLRKLVHRSKKIVEQ
ncbi:RNA polymerase sigma factor [Brumimicrobium mesophilum]|uniref:RNA polymerase sigma factor n=1 Tax=Brumimicrobium mesophilum TaxID=392717 RepID=UPI000D13FF09|nr:sigma-70 family RNA polymerase sigma factor [Brumimicrobium mesophilum]